MLHLHNDNVIKTVPHLHPRNGQTNCLQTASQCTSPCINAVFSLPCQCRKGWFKQEEQEWWCSDDCAGNEAGNENDDQAARSVVADCLRYVVHLSHLMTNYRVNPFKFKITLRITNHLCNSSSSSEEEKKFSNFAFVSGVDWMWLPSHYSHHKHCCTNYLCDEITVLYCSTTSLPSNTAILDSTKMLQYTMTLIDSNHRYDHSNGTNVGGCIFLSCLGG